MPDGPDLPKITDEIPENELEAEAAHAHLVAENGDAEEDADAHA